MSEEQRIEWAQREKHLEEHGNQCPTCEHWARNKVDEKYPVCLKWSDLQKNVYLIFRNDAPWCQFFIPREGEAKNAQVCPVCGTLKILDQKPKR